MKRKLLTQGEIETALGDLKGWRVDGVMLKRRFDFEDFAAALAFVNLIGEAAEKLDHHPDITFGWGYAEVVTTTHDRGGITDFDLSLARSVDDVA